MSTDKFATDQNNFGQRLKAIREGRDLTLKELNEITGISFSYIARIEKGERDPKPLVKEKLEEWMASGQTGMGAFKVESVFDKLLPEEAELIKYYRQLCTEQKLMIIPMMRGLLNSPTKSEENENRERVLKAAS